ncbi:RsmD family RNA methyltransferase [Microbacterium sp. cx-55]|uniref:RsmD family RNA methyltransferase n=1 Tax=Microbacterium sp. cx-55 TaxID=2875948 RepID=UPI001CBCCDEF|nr:RsmD family RNA methyltransferase [Microbacterium sp. cx-55]MBZ4486106.1 RsmD family RNA methyltransferase [Microbacterium sp. cx-55]UGB34023.1 RsmD family RNA methyltransferase [Microbacterium sp. cx-55]
MTRIIAGAAGGIRLDVPGSGTRPTSERVREAMFGSLDSAGAIDDARVLDLYAGSGALALEALSRGASTADLVELGGPAASVATRNADRVVRACGDVTARVHRAAVSAYLARAVGPFDLVFIDPPYDLTDADLAAALALLRPSLSPTALVVVERGKRSVEPDWNAAGLDAVRARTYGDTTVFWAEPHAAPDDAAQPRDESQSR